MPDMTVERDIAEEWLWRVVNTPDREWLGDDGNMRYASAIRERGGQALHVVVNPDVQPNRIITVFFDRRLMKRVEE